MAKFFDPHGWYFLTGVGLNGLYQLSKGKGVSTALAVRSHSLSHPTDLATWHQWLAHVGLPRIKMMMDKGLVDRLDVTNHDIPGQYVDCHVGQPEGVSTTQSS